ncbi:hypothetical protein [Desulfosporosinus sp. SB140]|uniref:hypothetical protein n=1 Tax=Desulfosporosinus paludis TaxID=3115649 RepID=UPI003890AC65
MSQFKEMIREEYGNICEQLSRYTVKKRKPITLKELWLTENVPNFTSIIFLKAIAVLRAIMLIIIALTLVLIVRII